MTFKARSSRINASGSPILNNRCSARKPAAWFSGVRKGVLRIAIVAGIAASGVPAGAVTPSAEDGFAPRANAQVVASAIDSSGRIVVAGYFTELQTPGANNPFAVGRIARINSDGSIDTSFNPNANGPVTSILIEPNGNIVIGGYFTTLGSGAGAVTRNRVARLLPDGTVDPSFDPNVGGATPSLVHVSALARDSGGRILIGGEFTTIAPNNGASTPRQRIARFNSNGTFDSTFTPAFSNVVRAIAIDPAGNIVVGGGFTTATSAGGTTALQRGRLARLSPAGIVDPNYAPNADNLVTALAFEVDGSLIAVGNFLKFQPPGTTAVNHSRIARIKSDGTPDESFRAGLNADAQAVAVTPDGRIIVSGVFRAAFSTGQAASTRADYIARFAGDGSLDTSFFPGPSYTVSTFAIQSDGRIFIGGYFTDFAPAVSGSVIVRRYMARLNEDGTLDSSFDPSAGGTVSVVVQQSDGNLLLGGTFGSIAGVTRRGVARISATGAIDPVFDPTSNGQVLAFAVQPTDGKVIIGGSFSQLTPNGSGTPVTRNFLARVNPNGTLDTSFDPSPNGPVTSIAVQADGKILIGGNFSTLNPNGATTAVERSFIARLESNGNVDTGFTTITNGALSSIVVESDNRILIGGSFSVVTVNGTGNLAGGLARLNSDGTVVSGFSPNTNGPVSTVRLYTDGKILFGGQFTTLTPVGLATPTTIERQRIAMLNADGTVVEGFDPKANGAVNVIAPLADGKILVGGDFTTFTPNGATEATTLNRLARLNSDGTVDTAFNPNPNGRIVSMVAQSNGGLVVSGGFTGFRPSNSTAVQLTRGLARILADGSVDLAFRPTITPGTGEVRAVAYQNDGSIFVAGSFTGVAGSVSSNLIRLRSEGIIDGQFNPNPDGAVEAVLPRSLDVDPTTINRRIGWLTNDGRLRTGLNLDPNMLIDGVFESLAVQADGKVLAGGNFSVTANGLTLSNLVRFNADGSLDTTFQPKPDGIVYDIEVTATQIIIVGSFTKLGDVTRNGIARLAIAGGTIDTSFNPNATGLVFTVAVQPDNKILIGGQFTALNPTGADTATTMNRIARLNADGTLDSAFNPNANGEVSAIAIQPGTGAADFKILIGGIFSALQPNGATSATSRSGFARLLADGSIDTAFDPKPNSVILSITPLSGGKILVGGNFTSFSPNGATTPTLSNYLARLNNDGSVDTAFAPNPNGTVYEVAIQSDGALVIGGLFTTVGGSVRNRLARVSAEGVLDTTFNPNASGTITSVVILNDDEESIVAAGAFAGFRIGGVVLAGGDFEEIGDTTSPYLALLSTDGTPIPGAVPEVDGIVRAFALQQDGMVVLGGDFLNANGESRTRLARLLEDNALDPDYTPSVDGSVRALALQADGRLLVGGTFGNAGGAAHANLARLQTNGTIDAGFTAATDGPVYAISIQADGKILVGGSFTTLAGTACTNLGRLNSDGSFDGTFSAGVNGTVRSIAIQTDESILIGGSFTMAGGATRANLAKLTPSGAADPNYDAMANGPLFTLVLGQDGKLLVGGAFSQIGGESRYLVARLASSSQAQIKLSVGSDNNSLNWLRDGSGPEVVSTTFEIYDDGEWSTPMPGTRDPGVPGWTFSGLSVAPNTLFYARVRATVPSNQGGSASFIEMIRALYISSSSGGSGGSNEPPEVPARPANFLAETYLSAHPELANSLYGEPDRLDLAWVHYWTHSRESDTEQIFLPPPGEASVDPKLNNLSARSWVGPGEDSLIMGIYVADAPAKLLVRALGPSLAAYGIGNPLSDPSITVYAGSTPIASNDDWSTESTVTPAALSEAGVSMNDVRDSAIVITLDPGSYTFVISSKGGTGVGLGELFLLSGGTGRLTNLSARARVGVGGDLLVAGFNRVGVGELLVRGLGPELANHNIVNFLADPYITLHKQSTGTAVLANDDWGQVIGAISDKNVRAGALPLTDGSKDSAAYLKLGSGGYTVHVTGAGEGETGVALIELFELQ